MMTDQQYEDMLRSMVLVDTDLDANGDEVFVIKMDGEQHGTFEDPGVACDRARDMALTYSRKWDVTIQARNAADME